MRSGPQHMQTPSDRREFLKTAAGTLALLLSRHGLTSAQAAPPADDSAGPPVGFGVIGLGAWGREILAALGRIPTAHVETICDIYEPFLIQIGFLDRTPRGRLATPLAYEHFGIKTPGSRIPSLFDPR